MTMRNIEIEDFVRAYKKLKSSIYFDKARIYLSKRIVDFESAILRDVETSGASFQDAFNDLYLSLHSENDETWNNIIERICDSISVKIFPKSTGSWLNGVTSEVSSDKHSLFSSTNHEDRGTIIHISEISAKEPLIQKTQSYIDMDIEGFLLGMLWCMAVGTQIDNTFGNHVYGNRTRKAVRDKPSSIWTMSPYLFEPYFSQYESWRDEPIEIAERIVDEDGDDALIVMTDIKSFYYSVDFNNQCWDALERELNDSADDGAQKIMRRLNRFIQEILEHYSKKFDARTDGRVMLPIGFEPSGILANWYLAQFDNEVLDKINPAFYGRYVDDIVLVEKVPAKSKLAQRLRSDSLDTSDILECVFGIEEKGSRFCATKSDSVEECVTSNTLIKRRGAFDGVEYEINHRFFHGSKPNLILQASKTNSIILDKGAQRPLLEHFKKVILANSSEFRLMPELGELDIDSAFSDIFEIDPDASPNKLRDLRDLKLNKFELSKYLGKCQRIIPLVEDEDASRLRRQLVNLFSYAELIEYYTTWEKLLQITLFTDNIDMAIVFSNNVIRAIDALKGEIDPEDPQHCSDRILMEIKLEGIKAALLDYFVTCVKKTLALCADAKIDAFCNALQFLFDGREEISLIKQDAIKYLRTCMVDKYAMPIAPTLILKAIFFQRSSCRTHSNDKPQWILFNLYDLEQIMHGLSLLTITSSIDDFIDNDLFPWSPLPYYLKYQDLQFGIYCLRMSLNEAFLNPKEQQEYIEQLYMQINCQSYSGDVEESGFGGFFKAEDITKAITAENTVPSNMNKYLIYYTNSSSSNRNNFNVAISNVCLPDNTIKAAMEDAQSSYQDYKELARLLNTSKQDDVDIIVLPELCVPLKWLPQLQSFSSKEDIAIVCGIRYVRTGINGSSTYNLTATILPYTLTSSFGSYQYANVHLHKKVFFPPKEQEIIQNYGSMPQTGDEFELYLWKGMWFSVYCCFEIASPAERIAFSAFVDATIVTEWNRDIGYYDNIISSLSRDLSCYCLQANNSIYGDSRLEQPKRTENRTMMQVSGGKNWSILIGEIDLDAIRTCQILKDGGKDFKPPAPDFKHDIAKRKKDGTLLNWILRKIKSNKSNG